MRLRVFDVAILRGSRRDEILEQVLGDVSDLGDRAIERVNVHLGWFGRTADFAHVLQGSGVHLFIVRGGLEVVEGVDVSAHAKNDIPGELDREAFRNEG
jgi:hypothetical protein